MATVQELVMIGEKIGLQGEALQSFVQEQQTLAREERTKEREHERRRAEERSKEREHERQKLSLDEELERRKMEQEQRKLEQEMRMMEMRSKETWISQISQ